ncbi:MAG: arsenate reductase ArsC [Thermoplasmata archaeon]|nr:arsenate reductase ArsC [Thermoplasmata archaeon]
MAEGIVRHDFGDKFDVHSAGANIAPVHPLAVMVMSETGIDISEQGSKPVGEFLGERFDYVVTLCGDSAKDVCPLFLGEVGERLHWNFPDPVETEGTEEEVLSVFRKVRDGIKKRYTEFVDELKET